MKRLLLPALVLLAGNLALLGALRGREYAAVRLVRDPDGRILNAAPGPGHIARSGSVTLDYSVELRNRIPVPAATGGDRGLDDVRSGIRWVRSLLSVGDDYHAESWYLSDVREGAREGRRFMCDSYSRALVNASLRQGYSARVVLLDGHISSEVYLPEIGRWVFADALYDFIASTPGGEPLSVFETAGRFRRGEAVEWVPVVGERHDDAQLHASNLLNVEAMMRGGRFRVVDGVMGFGRITRTGRMRDFLLGRTHIVEHAPAGAPASDGDERAVRGLLVAWNIGLPLIAGLVLTRRDRLRTAPAAAPAR